MDTALFTARSHGATTSRRLNLLRDRSAVGGIAALTVAARMPFLWLPTGPDEGGLLMVASQWRPGTSLYGDYWVDRPPVLIDVFVLADRLGGLLALRVIGLSAVVVSVLLAGRIARLVGGSSRAAALSAAVFLCTPLFGVQEVNGELLAVPFVLAAVAASLQAARSRSARARAALSVAAGVLAAAAALVKQNEVDAFVVIGVGALTYLAGAPRRGRTALALAGIGAVATTTVVVLQAAALGTGPRALWDAVVTFRLDAARLIGTMAPASTTGRLHGVTIALLASGAPLVLVCLARCLPRTPPAGVLDLRWPTLAVLAWETFSVLGGGSYWLHYLICLVPGLVLAASVVTASATDVRRPLLLPALGLAVASCLVALTVSIVHAAASPPDPVISWLREHRTPGQTGVVAFGHPDYLAATGLSSPYPELWSLPVRVRDPQLSELDAVLSGPDRPDWIITNSTGTLDGWGVDASAAQPDFDAHYRLVADLGSKRIYLDGSEPLTTTPQETS